MPLHSNASTILLNVISLRVEVFGRDRISKSRDLGGSLFEIENKNTRTIIFK